MVNSDCEITEDDDATNVVVIGNMRSPKPYELLQAAAILLAGPGYMHLPDLTQLREGPSRSRYPAVKRSLPEQPKGKRIPRNSLCTCGSEKKYKHCCYLKGPTQ